MPRKKKIATLTVSLSLANVISQLTTEQLLAEIQKRIGSSATRASSAATDAPSGNGRKTRKRKHKMSPEGRARIAAAAKKRWADAKKKGKKTL